MATGYPPQGGPPVVAVMPQFGDGPMQVTCGNCHATVVTTTVTENGACAWIAAVIVLLLCCPLFWIPLCIDTCKDVHHKCPSCGAQLGAYKRI